MGLNTAQDSHLVVRISQIITRANTCSVAQRVWVNYTGIPGVIRLSKKLL